MIAAAGHGLDDSLHFKLEEEAGEGGHRKVGADGQLVDGEVVGGCERVDDTLLVGRERGEELPLDTFAAHFLQHILCFPAHGVGEIFGRRDEGGAVVAYQLVATLAVFGSHGTGKGKRVTVVVARQPGRNESAAPCRALYEDAGVTHARYDTVAAHEVGLVGVGAGGIFGEQSAVCGHFVGCVAVGRRIERVEAVSQYAHRRQAVVERLSVGVDVNAVGQSADDERVGTEPLQVGHETADEILSVGRAVAGAHDADHVACVEVCRAPIVESQRRVGALQQPSGVAFVFRREYFHVVLFGPSQLFVHPSPHCVRVLKERHEAWRGLGHQCAYVVAVPYDVGSVAHLPIKHLHLVDMPESQSGQYERIVDFLCVNHLYLGIFDDCEVTNYFTYNKGFSLKMLVFFKLICFKLACNRRILCKFVK